MRAGVELAGRYRLDRPVGRGGMGEVWEAFDVKLRRRVAVKLLLAHPVCEEESRRRMLARFRREAKAVARLNHPHIVGVHDVGEHRTDLDDGEAAVPFQVLEFLEGRTLKSVLDEHPDGLPVDQALDYAAQIADALAAAHKVGIVHRDIKPANLMLLPEGTIKVCDFGIAHLQDATAALSTTGAVLGTPLYMPPEQLQGVQVDHRADLYALGSTLHHLLTGRPVFHADNLHALVAMHLTRTPDLPSTHRPHIDPEIDDLVACLLAKDPAERPATASQTAASLRAALSRRSPADTDARTADSTAPGTPRDPATVMDGAKCLLAGLSITATGLLILWLTDPGTLSTGNGNCTSAVGILSCDSAVGSGPAPDAGEVIRLLIASFSTLPIMGGGLVFLLGVWLTVSSLWRRDTALLESSIAP